MNSQLEAVPDPVRNGRECSVALEDVFAGLEPRLLRVAWNMLQVPINCLDIAASALFVGVTAAHPVMKTQMHKAAAKIQADGNGTGPCICAN